MYCNVFFQSLFDKHNGGCFVSFQDSFFQMIYKNCLKNNGNEKNVLYTLFIAIIFAKNQKEWSVC